MRFRFIILNAEPRYGFVAISICIVESVWGPQIIERLQYPSCVGNNMGAKWSARDFFILVAIGLAGIIFEAMQYSQAVEVWGENCSEALTYAELSPQCQQFSDDMNWVLYELWAIVALTVFSLVMGVVRLAGGGQNRKAGEGFKILRIFIIMASLTLTLLFLYSFVIRSTG